MKTKFKSLGWPALCSIVVLLSVLTGYPVNDCPDNPYYITSWTCSSQGSVNTYGTLSQTNFSICAGGSVSAPTFTVAPTFNNGQKTATLQHTTCPSYQEQVYQTVVYTSSSPYFVKTNASWPNFPGTFTTPGVYYYIAEFDGTPSGGVCSSIIGATSAVVTVTVTSSPPVILTQPVSQTVTVGNNASFNVVATGCPNVSYQWRFNATNLIAGATGSTLALMNVQLTNAGNYTVVVTNYSGIVTSSIAVLTVTTPICTNLTSGLVAWWPGETNANDRVGTNNGLLQGSMSFSTGKVGQAFSLNQTNASIKIPASANLNVGTSNGFTLEAWIKPLAVTTLQPIFEWNSGSTIGNAWGVHFYISSDAGPGSLYANIVDSNGNSHSFASANNPVVTNAYQHVALVYDKNTGVAKIYYNGTVVGQSGVGTFTPKTGSDLYLGRRPTAEQFGYTGLIDEPAIYGRPLSQGEIQALYNASSAGRCFSNFGAVGPIDTTNCLGGTANFAVNATGCSPLTYAWKFSGDLFQTNILSTNSTLTLSNISMALAGTYSVIVKGDCGAVTNSAKLSILTNLSLYGPIDISVCSGATATFAVTAYGSGPLAYQWKYGTYVLSAQTNSSLTITNVGSTNTGTYSVTVVGACGSLTKSATLKALTIVSSPVNKSIVYGQSASFSVEAMGADSPNFQWRKNGINIPGATSSAYTAVGAGVSDSGSVYDVIVSSPGCSITSAGATLTVTKAPLWIAADPQRRLYGQANPSFTWSATGFMYGEDSSVLTGAPVLTTTAITNSNVGTYTIQAAPGTVNAANYSLFFSNGVLTVSQTGLIIRPDDKTRTYGSTNPILTWSAIGLVNGETTNVLTGAPALNTIATTNSSIGTYPITASIGTLASQNYSFAVTNGTLTISPAILTVVADDKLKQTGTANPPLTGVITGLKNNDIITAVFCTPATTWSPAGTYPIIPSWVDPDGRLANYSAWKTNGTLTISDCAPYILSQSSGTVLANYNATISLRVFASGASPITYLWKKNGGSVIQPNVTGISTAWLTITNLNSTNLGTYTCILSNVCGATTSAPIVLTLGDFQNTCDLYPIALPISIITNLPNGPAVTVNSSDTGVSGSFLWLKWTGDGSANALRASLTVPGNSTNYVNPHIPEDHVISIDDWIQIDTGVSATVSSEMNALTNYCANNYIKLPIWYNNPRGGGGSGELQFYNYANIQLANYSFNGQQSTITVKYYGTYQCEPTAVSFSIIDALYTEKSAPIVIDPAANVYDFNIGSLSVSFITNGLYEDFLSITNQGTQPNQISVSNTNLYYTFTNNYTLQIGTFAPGSALSPLLVVFNQNSTIDAVRATVRALTYGNTNNLNPSTVVRTLEAVLSHASVTNIQRAIFNVHVQPVNDAPTVQVLSPANYQSFAGGTTIPLTASASDPDSAVAAVKFYSGTTFLGYGQGLGNGSYTLNWDGAPIGTNDIHALAYDVEGASGTSTNINVVVSDNAPTVFIITPQNNSQQNALATIRLTSIAQDDGTVTNVVYYRNGTNIGSSSISPYVLNLKNVAGGTNVFQAVAYDNRGQTGSSPFVTNVVIKLPPTIQITQPVLGSVFVTGENTLVAAQASDADGQVTNVQFCLGSFTNSVRMASSNNFYYTTWSNVGPVSLSTNLFAIASDNDGLTSTSTVAIAIVDPCVFPGVSNLVLSLNSVVGGGGLTGTLYLSNAAPAGGEAVSLGSSASFLNTPAFVIVPQNSRTVSFDIATTEVNVTNIVTISAWYHNQSPAKTASVTVFPGTAASNGTGTNGNASAGLITTDLNTLTPEDLVREIVGPEVVFSNVRYTGATNAAGIFTGGNGIIGFDGGLILSSGDIQNVIGPNDSSGATGANGADGDNDLNGLVTGTGSTFDAAILEFDFIPETEVVTWDYVFGSEEYNEWVGSFNDVFGFFLNGTNVAVLPDGMPVSINNVNNYANSQYYRDNALGGSGGDPINSPFDTQMDGLTTVLTVSAHVIPGVVNHIKLAVADTGDSVLDSLVMIRAGSFRTGGTTVYTRDDGNRQYTPFMVSGPQSGGASSNAVSFNFKGVRGTVQGARLERNGWFQASAGSKFDLEFGAAAKQTNFSSYGLLITNAQSQSQPYSTEWKLPADFNQDIQAQLQGICSLTLTDRLSSICGGSYTVSDQSQAAWPTKKNILTIAVLTDRTIPRGRCRDFVLTGVGTPANGTWDIRFRDQIIASSGQPNGWDVEEDHTPFGGYIVTVPITATSDQGYEVRVEKPDEDVGISGTFAVLPPTAISTVPVLLPLLLSTNAVNSSSGGPVKLTVSIDAPAPFGDAYIALYSSGPGAANVPDRIVIPAGQTAVTTNLQINAGESGTLDVLASYNGYRKAKVQVIAACQSPSAPASITARTNELGILLNWPAVAGATAYNISRSTNATSLYSLIFAGLTTTNFVDTTMLPAMTNYYRVTALSNWCESAGWAQTSAMTPIPAAAPSPWIIPFGGVFNDSKEILLTNRDPGVTIYYTTNGQIPTISSPSFSGKGNIILHSNAIVRAFAKSATYSQQSSVVSAGFKIVQPAPIGCGSNDTGSLTAANSYSTVNGIGFFCSRYVYNAGTSDIGNMITITAQSSDFDTVLYLKDASTNILAFNDDISDVDTDSQITFQVRNAGAHIIELTSYNPQETGDFSLALDCLPLSDIAVYTNAVSGVTSNSVLMPNYGFIDFGTNAVGVSITNYITITNSGKGDLMISNIAVYPTASTNGGNGFTISPTNTITLVQGARTNIAISLSSSVPGTFHGYVVFKNNSPAMPNTPSQNPFYIEVEGSVRPPAGPPFVEIYFPTNGMYVPATNSFVTNVMLEIDAIAMDEDGIQRVEFYTNYPGTPFQSVTNPPYTIVWTNPPAGQRTITAKAYDTSVPQQTSTTNVLINVGVPTLVISPTNPCVGISNSTLALTATLLDATNGPIVGTNVIFTISGAHNLSYTNPTVSGQAVITYRGTNAGTDRITASTVVNGITIQSDVVIKKWAQPVVCGSNVSGTLTNTDGFSSGCNCAVPSHYADEYSISGNAGDVVTVIMRSSDFSTYQFVMDTNCSSVTVTNEMIGTNDTRVQFSLPSTGTYIIEATSSDAFKTGSYSLQITCGAQTNANIAVLNAGTNVQSYSMIDMGVTTNYSSLTKVITVTNKGNATLYLTNFYFTLPNVFSITPPAIANLAPGASVNYTIQFLATNSGQYSGSLVLSNSDPVKGVFVVNLTAISNPNGTPPTVNVTAPTNNSQFIAPTTVAISANATNTAGTAITNVQFVFQNSQGNFLIGSDSVAPYTVGWQPSPGNYSVFAVAYDSLGHVAISPMVTNIQVYPSTQNHAPIATNDYQTVLANSVYNVLDVLSNDFDADGDSLTITNVTVPLYGTAEVINSGKAVRYTPKSFTQGTDGFSYDISDGHGGSARGCVWITVAAGSMPHPTMHPDSGAVIAAGTYTNLSVTIDPPEALPNVVKVQYFAGSDMIGEVTTFPYTNFLWLARAEQCDCGIHARAYDKFGQYSDSQAVHYTITNNSGSYPLASIDSPAAGTYTLYKTPETHTVSVQDGILVVTGSVYQVTNAGSILLTNAAQYKVLIKATDGTILRDSGWLAAREVHNGIINTNDLTTLQNDIYDLELLVRNDYATTNAIVRFSLDSNLKIGVFTFNERDMVIPVNGLPLTVVRTYNSMNPNAGDFGYSWTYAINDMDVELHEDRAIRTPLSPDEEGPLPGGKFTERVGGSRDVTLTLPDGRRATFYYYEVAGDCGSDSGAGLTSIQLCAEPRYQAPPGLNATLRPVDKYGGDIGGYDFYTKTWQKGGGETPLDSFDFPGFILTLQDGTEFYIKRDFQGSFTFLPDDPGNASYDDDFGDDITTPANFYVDAYGKPRLAEIRQRDGNVIRINDSGVGDFSIEHFTPLNNKTRSIYFQRDTSGRIAAITDPMSQDSNGNPTGYPAIKYEYDGAGNLAKVLKLLDRSGGTYLTNQYLYEISLYPHYITSVIDPRGIRITRNIYDNQGRLVGTVDASGYTNRFDYDITGQHETQYDRMGNPTTYIYNTHGNVLQSVDPMGHTNSYQYDDNNHLIASIDPLGNTTSYTRDAIGNPLSITMPFPVGADPANYTATYTYDGLGNRTAVISPGGAMITNVYDSSGRTLSTSDESGRLIQQLAYDDSGNLKSEMDRMGVTLSFGYDAMGNLTNASGSSNQALSAQYDANGNVTTVGSGGGGVIGYDAQNRETSVNAGNGLTANITIGNQPEWTQVSSPTIGNLGRSFDEQGRLSTMTSAYGTVTSYGYDPDGRMAYKTNQTGQVLHYVYDQAGRMVSVTNLMTGAASSYNLDAVGRPLRTTDGFGNATCFSYNPDGSIAAMTNALGSVWTYSYDTVIGCCGSQNAAGTETDPLGRQKLKINSAHGLPMQIIYFAGANASTNTITYWSLGDDPEDAPEDYIESVTDEGGHTRRYNYTDLGQPWQASDQSGLNFWTNTYSSDGNVSAVSGPTGETTAFHYDGLDNVTTVQFPDGNWRTNTYDLSHNLLASTRLPGGQTVNFSYDDMGRLTNRISSIGENVSVSFDAFDRIYRTQDENGSSTNLYDNNGRLSGTDNSDGSSVRYGYDLLDRLTIMYARAGVSGAWYTNKYAYDIIGNLTNISVTINGTTLDTTYTYDKVNRLIKRKLPNGILTTYDYDWRDRVTNVVHRAADGSLLASVGYERQGVGQPTAIMREDGSYVALAYDSSFRLTNEIFYNASHLAQSTNSYAYDAAGTRILKSVSGLTYTNDVQAGYQVQQIRRADNGAVSARYSYDAGGRVTSASNSVAALTLGYNTSDQVTAVTNGTSTSLFTYDANGRRVKAIDNATNVRRFVLGAGRLDLPVLIADGNGNMQQGYVYAGDAPLLRFDSAGNVTYYLEDALGSVIGLAPMSNPSTSTTTRLFYDSFGNSRGNNGPNPTVPLGTGGDFRFQSMWLEQATLLYHTRAREYDPNCGRFCSRDSQGDFKMPESLNPYVFVMNNPLIYTDRTGEWSLVEINMATAIDFILNSIGDAAVSWGEAEVKSKMEEVLTQMLLKQLPHFEIPWDINKIQSYYYYWADFAHGNALERVVWSAICYVLREGGQEWSKALHHNVRVANKEGVALGGLRAIVPGDPLNPGDNCEGANPAASVGAAAAYSIPDLIVGPNPPLSGNTLFDGEVKLKTSTFFKDYFPPARKKSQLRAILMYARRHTDFHTSMFFVGFQDQDRSGFIKRKVDTLDEAESLVRGVGNGVLSLYIPVHPAKLY